MIETMIERDATGNLEDQLKKSKVDVKMDADIMLDQRDKANEDMRFVNVTGGMWEDWRDSSFEDRAKMEFDLVSNHLFRYMGEWNLNRQGVEYRPDDDVTSDADAELLNGIHRADFRDGSGKIALDNAVYEAATCGVGAFKMANVMEDEFDPEDERQRIEWQMIVNAFNTVYWDAAAIRPDKRDARWVTVLKEYNKSSFADAFGEDIQPISAYVPETRRFLNFSSTVGTGANTDPIYVATRYEIIRKREAMFFYNNLVSGEVEIYNEAEHEDVKDELRRDTNRTFLKERKILRQHVEKSVFTGDQYIEEPKRIVGRWLPIIPIYGYRSYVDGAEWYFGLVRKLKDASRLFNMHMNQLAENAASNGQPIPIFDPKQMPQGIANLWADKNNKSYLLAKSLLDANGNPIHHGPTGYLQPGAIDQNAAASLQAVIQFIQDTTGGVPKDTMDPNASGKAIKQMMKRENLNTQPLSDNINTGIQWEGVVYQSMAAEVYSREQMVRTVGMDGTDGREHLLKVVMDEQTGKFIQANNLRGKKFRAYADVGPQYESMREETVETLKAMGEFLQNTPAGEQYLEPIIFSILDNMEGVGLGPLKDINRRNMILKGLKKPETDEEKQLVADAQEPKPDPQAELIDGLTKQATAEATKFESQARNLDSGSVKNIAAARKANAEAEKIKSEIPQNRAKTLVELRKQQFEEAKNLPFGPS